VVYKRTWRSRSVDNVIKELEIISNNKRITDVFFVDDNVLVNMKRIGKLCIEIIRRKREGTIKKNLRFFFQGRLDTMAKYPKITKLMGIAGFWLVLVGIEATNDKTLELIGKGCKMKSMEKGIEVLHKSGIFIMGNVIIGANLSDTLDDVLVSIKKTRDLGVDLPSFTLLTPFPSTEFHKKLKKENLLLTEDYAKYNWLNPVIKTLYLSPNTLKNLLFLGFFYINYYGGGWVHKLVLLYKSTKIRGFKFTFHPIRFYRTLLSYYRWRCIVHYHLKELGKTIHQIKFGSLGQMEELKKIIIKT
jgi:radical SAM superfamily enzyme YgiQ (UPF0313 family)